VWRPDANGAIGETHGERVPVRLGVDLHGFNTHVAAGPVHSHGDLATVGDEDAFYGFWHCIRTTAFCFSFTVFDFEIRYLSGGFGHNINVPVSQPVFAVEARRRARR
jgi:hypothetical protein